MTVDEKYAGTTAISRLIYRIKNAFDFSTHVDDETIGYSQGADADSGELSVKLQETRAAMGLGNTLGALPVSCGGTGSTDGTTTTAVKTIRKTTNNFKCLLVFINAKVAILSVEAMNWSGRYSIDPSEINDVGIDSSKLPTIVVNTRAYSVSESGSAYFLAGVIKVNISPSGIVFRSGDNSVGGYSLSTFTPIVFAMND